MNKFLRLLFVLVIIAMLGASILQIFLPSYLGEHSGYGISAGWQREIGIWNLAVLIIILAVNIKVRLVLSTNRTSCSHYWRNWNRNKSLTQLYGVSLSCKCYRCF